jgi:alkylation response protein AidB-like acyl-CoA dehydrogenase
MDFGFSPEQEMLRDSVRKLLDAACPPSLARAMMADATAHPPALWRALAELGVLGVLVPAEQGGQGGSFLDLTVVLEEAGKSLVPEPFLATTLAQVAIARAATAAQCADVLPPLAAGERLAAFALPTDDGGGADLVTSTVETDPDGWRIRGTVPFVLDAHVADTLVVPAHDENGVTLFAIDRTTAGVAVTEHRTVDLTRRLASLALDVRVPVSALLGSRGAAAPVVAHVLRHARAALAVEAVGVAQRALDLSVAYANERQQFGRPIGSFQAVKHKCVDMMVGVETARSLAYYAAWAVTENAPDVDEAVAMAKAYASDVATTVTSEAIQVHGGIGFTWEHDIHLYHRRALAIAAAFGSGVELRDRVADAITGA